MDKKKRFISLKAKIIISTLIPVVVSLALISSVIFLALFNSLHETAEAELLQISEKYANSFEGNINSAMNYLSILASELEVRAEAGSTDRETLQKTILNVFDDYKLIDGSSVYFEPDMYDGRDADYIGSEYGTAQSGRICWYFYMDGGKTAYLPEAMENDIEFELPHYTMAKVANKPIYTDPVTYEIDGSNIPMFTLTYPIHNSSGDFIGAVTVDLFLDDIYEQLQQEEIYETGYVLIANDNGRMIYSPRYEDIGRTREETGLDYSLPSGDEASFVNSKSIINSMDTLVSLDSIYIPQLDSSFYISVTAPLDEINEGGTRLTVFFVIFAMAVVAGIALLLYYLIGKISAPLDEITESVDKIAGGDIGARIKGAYKGEFAVVKDSVNTMADSIEAYIEESKNSLGILKNILNGLDAVIYVTNPDTDEILFINDSMKELFSIEGDGVGLLCYKVFQDGFNERCDFCPCHQLDKEPDKAVVWEEHNTVTKRDYRNTDRYIEWIGGKKAHLQHSVDITDIKMAEAALEKRLQQQKLMADLSQIFISSGNIDEMITKSLQMTGEFMSADRILLSKYEGQSLHYQYEWLCPSGKVKAKQGSVLPIDEMDAQIAAAFQQRAITHFNLDDTDRERLIDRYELDDLETFLMLPVFAGDELWGVLEFDQCVARVPWTPSDINLGEMIAGILSGVVDRGQMEKQLMRLSAIVESSPQFIAYITHERYFEYFNPAAMDLTGYTREELTQGGLRLLYGDETDGYVADTLAPAIHEKGKLGFELSLKRKDGQERIMSISAFTIGNDADGSGIIAMDITEIRRLEKELIKAKELAEQSSRSKSEFLSRMSHEMRTPMNAIIGMTSLAKDSNDIERKDYCLDKIDSASTHLLGVINDVLDMSKIEAGKFELSNTDFSLEKMLIRITNVLNYRIEEKKQHFNVKVDPDVPQAIVSDEQRLNQVITNLLGNAVKFTPEGGAISLFVRKRAEENGVITLEFEVKDTGIGISEEQQKRLFTLFEQADGGISRKYGGTGLGLAISKSIVEMMDGKVWIESELGRGSSFIFHIRAKRGSLPKSLLPSGIHWNNLRVLVVDDSEDVREFFLGVSEPLGLRCEVAASGEEAFQVIERRGPFNIIFVDWKMPGMDGIELTKRIKEQYGENTVVIMISAYEWSRIEAEAKQAGVDRFISKPLFTSVIADCINECLGLRQDEAQESGAQRDMDGCFEGRHILLAEDVEINREIVIALLEPTGIQIDCAENGKAAYQMFRDNPDYDMIFMDIHMPEVNGYESTAMIRALPDPRAQTVPIIAMTANVFREDIERCLEAGMNAHVGKPLDIDDVMAKLRQYLPAGS